MGEPGGVRKSGRRNPTKRPLGGGLIVNVSGPVPVPLPFVALRVMLNVPTTVGVPKINPVAEFTVKPAGNGAAPHVVIA